TPPLMSRTDYSANAGDGIDTQNGGGPANLSDANYQKAKTTPYTGIFFQCSEVKIREITRGTSNTLMMGERFLNPINYTTGKSGADNESMLVGFDNDLYRTTYIDDNHIPLQDVNGPDETYRYGSCHFGGFNVAYCDGHVDIINYDISMSVFN